MPEVHYSPFLGSPNTLPRYKSLENIFMFFHAFYLATHIEMYHHINAPLLRSNSYTGNTFSHHFNCQLRTHCLLLRSESTNCNFIDLLVIHHLLTNLYFSPKFQVIHGQCSSFLFSCISLHTIYGTCVLKSLSPRSTPDWLHSVIYYAFHVSDNEQISFVGSECSSAQFGESSRHPYEPFPLCLVKNVKCFQTVSEDP